MNVLTAIHERTSYRGTYKNAPVPKEDLEKIMGAGLAAPSGCNKQTTSLIAVDDSILLEKIHSVINPNIAETAPAFICVLTQRIIAYSDRCFSAHDYSAAIENMLLAIVELGYQSCWIEGHITDTDNIGRKIGDILNVPMDYDLVCILPVGVADEQLRKASKKPYIDRAWFNGFGIKK